MHTDDWETLSAQLANHMANVRRVFNELIGDDEAQSPDEQLAEYWRELWQDALEEDDASPALAHLNDADRRSVLALIADFRKELDRRTIGPRGRQVLDQLMPHLLSEICSRADAPLPLARITPLLTGIVTRTTYLELLSEFPGALKHLITLCAASPMVASQLARHPLLLDELLDPNTLYQPTATDAYRDELRQYLLRVPEEDEEQQLEALRQFKQAQQLHIAAADIAGTLPVMKVSDHLTRLPKRSSMRWCSRHGGRWWLATACRPICTIARGAASPSSATVSSAVGSWATAPISTWCSSMTARRR